MVKICVKSPEVTMTGDINIRAEVSVVTKAKLDEVNVRGECKCGDEPLITDYVILIDGSDSYNNKVVMKTGKVSEGEAFDQTKNWAAGLINNIKNSKNSDMATVSLVQFSGIKPLERSYKPGSDGASGSSGLDHYKIEIAPVAVKNLRNISGQATGFDALDGNGQLFLCLQDLAMDGFTKRIQKALAGGKRHTVIIVVSDEEWDIKYLENAFGSGRASSDSVVDAVHKAYSEVFAVIVRPNKFNDQNESFIIKKLCNGSKSNYHKVYTENFETDMNTAGSKILKSLGYEGSRFF